VVKSIIKVVAVLLSCLSLVAAAAAEHNPNHPAWATALVTVHCRDGSIVHCTATTIHQKENHLAIAVTAGHAFRDAYSKVFVSPPDAHKHFAARVISAGITPDVALLEYSPDRALAVAPLGKPRAGDEFAVRGFAHGSHVAKKYTGRITSTALSTTTAGSPLTVLPVGVAGGVSGAGVIVGRHTVAVVSAADHEHTVAVPAEVVFEVAQRNRIFLGAGSS